MVETYNHHSPLSWTRIEMLLELYDATIAALEQGHAELAAGRDSQAAAHLIRGTNLIVGIVSGLNHDVGQLGAQIERLCLFVIQQIGLQQLEPAIRVLRTLREAFEGIRDEAIQMERLGQLPDLMAEASLIATA